jgi:hypothetical protein
MTKETRKKHEALAYQRFIKLLDMTIDAAYEAGIENRGDVLTLPLMELRRVIDLRGTPAVRGA